MVDWEGSMRESLPSPPIQNRTSNHAHPAPSYASHSKTPKYLSKIDDIFISKFF
jgi:hypothetical protein